MPSQTRLSVSGSSLGHEACVAGYGLSPIYTVRFKALSELGPGVTQFLDSWRTVKTTFPVSGRTSREYACRLEIDVGLLVCRLG